MGKSRRREDETELLLKLYNDRLQGVLTEQKEWKACLAFLDFANVPSGKLV